MQWLIDLLRQVMFELQFQFLHLTSWRGFWSEWLAFGALYPAVSSALFVLLALVYAFSREWRLPFDPALNFGVAVVIPAYNEELVIARTIEGVLAQSYPRMDIHVVSDGSTDRTVEIARRYEDRGVLVHDLQPNRGKSAVLQYALDNTSCELFMVVDADSHPEPNAFLFLVQQFANPNVAAVTGNPGVRNVCNLLTAMQSLEYSVIVNLAKRAEQFWGGLFTVSGAAACFRTQALRSVGGWTSLSATEDIEMSWRLQKAGYELLYEPRAIFTIQAPEGLRALYKQRQRWAQGMVEVLAENRHLLSSRNAALIPVADWTIATALWVLLMLGTLLQSIWHLVTGAGPGWSDVLSRTETWTVLTWTIGLLVLQAFAGCVFDGHYQKRTMRYLPLALLYPVYYWLVIFPSFVIGGFRGLFFEQTGRWQRTERTQD